MNDVETNVIKKVADVKKVSRMFKKCGEQKTGK